MPQNIIAIASGKGGTGKTTVATNLAAIAAKSDYPVQILDCDVEAPNAHLFLKPIIEGRIKIGVPTPHVDEKRCDGCGECARICRFSAIVSLKTRPIVFPELCHGCGGCVRVCPKGAITEQSRMIGQIQQGYLGRLLFTGGQLKVGEAMSPPLIREVKKHAIRDSMVIIDAPPGTSCPVIEAIKGADYVVLVTEPTPFGLSDLSLAVKTIEALGSPFGVVVNRSKPGWNAVRDFCRRKGIEILAELPDHRGVAEAYSRGELAFHSNIKFRYVFSELFEKLKEKNKTKIVRDGC